ncbi:MAG TPA: FecR domain-containing protein [bacterium]|nr:FecR domain-containing protein [bacterium]HPN43024.1 FecR domain-containing protein [bacterium]
MNSIIHRLFSNKRDSLGGSESSRSVDINEPGYYKLPDPPDVEGEWDLIRRRIRQEEFVAHSPYRRHNLFLKPAIGFCMVCIAVLFAYHLFNRSNDVMEFSTAYRQQKTIELADQSLVQLNYDSRLQVLKGFNKKNRTVQLSGEACFQVTASKHPFIISTETGTVRVIGTEFNVRERNSRIEIAVNKGQVQLTVHNAGRDSSVYLTAQQYTSCRAGQFPEAPQYLAFGQFPAWLNNKININNSTFRQVCDEIERRFNVQIRIDDQSLAATEVTGLFEAGDIYELLKTLSILVNKEYHFENQIIVFDTSPAHTDTDS